MKEEDYQDGDQISRKQAWRDLVDNFTIRAWTWVERPLHMWAATWVDVARLIGVSDRERSQTVGRVLAVLAGVSLFAVLFSLSTWVGAIVLGAVATLRALEWWRGR